MYLIKIINEQISAHWDLYKYAIQRSLPPIAGETDDKMNNILVALLTEKLQLWITSEEPIVKQIRTVLTTKLAFDEVSQTKSLLLYSLFSFKPLASADVDAISEGLTKFGKANNCHRAIAYTDQDNVLSIARKYGMNPTYTLLSIDL